MAIVVSLDYLWKQSSSQPLSSNQEQLSLSAYLDFRTSPWPAWPGSAQKNGRTVAPHRGGRDWLPGAPEN